MEGEPNEPIAVLEEKIQSLMKDSLNFLDFSVQEIDICKRLGSKAQKDKPTLLVLTTERRVVEIFRNSKKLKEAHDGKINIREDLPKEIRAKRKELLKKMHRLREQGKYAVVKFDQLIVKDNNERVDGNIEPSSSKKGQKRSLSQSPATSITNQSKKPAYRNRNKNQNPGTHSTPSNNKDGTDNFFDLNDSFMSHSDDEKKTVEDNETQSKNGGD